MNLKTLALYTSVLSLMIVPAFAENDSAFGKLNKKTPDSMREEKTAEIEERREEMAEKREAMQGSRCEKLGAKIDQKVQAGKQAQERHRERHRNILERLSALRDRLSEAGYDVTDLDMVIDGLEDLLDILDRDQADYVKALESIKNTDCDEEGTGVFGLALQNAKDELLNVRGTLQEIRRYLQNDVKDVLGELKLQLKDRNMERNQEMKNDDVVEETTTE